MAADDSKAAMAKNIVICCDGTRNRFGRANTNIVKICECLERAEDQLVYYDPGVGTIGDVRAITRIKRRLEVLLGGAVGLGLVENVQQAYDFLAWHHRPGDRVFLFGFSRGAYTVRALAALLHMYGLTSPAATNLTPYLTEMLADDADSGTPTGDSGDARHQPTRWEIANSFKKHLGRPVTINMLGVFDTVCSVGWFWSPLRLPFTTRNKSVLKVRHAVAIDERRGFFVPDLYHPHGTAPDGSSANPLDIKEVWFAGVHCDVGGGYPRAEQGLAQIALQWMLREASEGPNGLRLDPTRTERVLRSKYSPPNPRGPRHYSLTPAWWLLEVLPKPVRYRDAAGRWRSKLYANVYRRRRIPSGATLHESVRERWHTLPEWRPQNLGELSSYSFES